MLRSISLRSMLSELVEASRLIFWRPAPAVLRIRAVFEVSAVMRIFDRSINTFHNDGFHSIY